MEGEEEGEGVRFGKWAVAIRELLDQLGHSEG